MEIKEKILESALNLFVQQGFSATTGSITKDAGVSAGILFHYFPTKKDLIVNLYARVILEYYQVSVQVMKDFPKDDPEKYRAIVRFSRDSLINWGLDNWQKFQFIQLFESSLLADQFKLDENNEIKDLCRQVRKIMRLGVEYRYLKDLPVEFLAEAGTTATTFFIKYLHENPRYRYDEDFMEKAWEIHWNMIAR